MILGFGIFFTKVAVLLVSLVPITFVILNSFRVAQWASPPFTNLVNFAGSKLCILLYFDAYTRFFSDITYFHAVYTSTILALTCVAITVPVGFFMSTSLLRLSEKWANILYLIIMVPLFIPFVVKVYAWINVAENYFSWCEPTLRAKLITLLFCCYSYLPIVVALIKEDLKKIDPEISHAASDLGASPLVITSKILLPLSMNAITISASITLIMAFGEFVIPDLLGAGTFITIGQIANAEFFTFHDLPMSSMISIFMIVWSLIPAFIMRACLMKEQK